MPARLQTFVRLLSLLFIAATLYGCGGSEKGLMELVAERDSIMQVNAEQTKRLRRINTMLETINGTVDSIAAREGVLFVNTTNREVPITRNDVLNNLQNYETLLKKQSEKIDRLQQQLREEEEEDEADRVAAGGGGGARKSDIDGLVRILRNEIAVKDALIAKLREDLQRKDVDIAELKQQVSRHLTTIRQQEQTITGLDQINKEQTKALIRQDEEMSQCYVLIGTKKDLERKGVVQKGKIVGDEALDRSKFAKVDIRKYRELSFSAKKPRILTTMPQQSYTLTKTGKQDFTLKITNPTDFWRISNYLVIMTD